MYVEGRSREMAEQDEEDVMTEQDHKLWEEYIHRWSTDPPRDGFVENIEQMSDWALEAFLFEFAGNKAERRLVAAELSMRGLSVDKFRWE